MKKESFPRPGIDWTIDGIDGIDALEIQLNACGSNSIHWKDCIKEFSL